MKKTILFLMPILFGAMTVSAEPIVNFQPKNFFQKKHVGPKSSGPRMIEVEEEVWFALHEEINTLRDEALRMQTRLKVAEAEIARLRESQYVEGGGAGATTYQVKEEDSLWKIAKKYYKDPFKWLWLFKANIAQLDDPDKIYPGQILDIPRYE